MLYAVTFSGVAVSAQQDLFELVAPSAGAVVIHELTLGQTSDQGDAQAEALSLQLIRGYTVSGSGGSSATPAPLNSAYPAAGTTAEVNNTTVANTGTVVTVMADVWNVQAGYQKVWTPETRPVLRNGQRLVVRQSAPADAITQSGTIVFEEI